MGRDYKNIVAWQRSHALTVAVYRESRDFPAEERFGVTSQLRRAASSVAANIAEGSGRATNRDFLQFLHIALGSLKETEYFLLLSSDLHYLDLDVYRSLTEEINKAFAALHGLILAVKKETNVAGRATAMIAAWLVMSLARITYPSPMVQ